MLEGAKSIGAGAATIALAGAAIGSRALSFALLKLGCPGGLALIVGFYLRALLTGEGFTNMMAPSGDSVTTWKEDTREIDILMESSWETEDTGSSVNQPVAPPVPPANQVASPEAGPSNPVRPFPYHEEDIFGGDSVRDIQRRLLANKPDPSLQEYRLARFDAEDLFEIKVEIIRNMIILDPEGDWMGRGARALDNPHTATGEESLEKLYSLLDELKQGGVESQAFSHLKDRVFRRRNDDTQHSAS
uniref:DUF8018 domain-containing protein n=1 Tax=Tamarix hispida TaxID=189793 RepID=A0A4P8F8U8_9CARY|nr:hypothetical protein [Tamarix hispida]